MQYVYAILYSFTILYLEISALNSDDNFNVFSRTFENYLPFGIFEMLQLYSLTEWGNNVLK